MLLMVAAYPSLANSATAVTLVVHGTTIESGKPLRCASIYSLNLRGRSRSAPSLSGDTAGYHDLFDEVGSPIEVRTKSLNYR